MRHLRLLFALSPLLLPTIAAPVPLIIDTDLAADVSNLISVCMVNQLVDRGEADLLAVLVTIGQPTAVGAISVVNHYFGHDQVPIGSYKGSVGPHDPGVYVDDLIAKFPSPIRNYSQVPEGALLYRETLSKQPDHSVVIVVHGFLTNLHGLMTSSPDEYSPLHGTDLLARKVKQVVMMGGQYPHSSPQRGEYNFAGAPLSTEFVLAHWPVQVPIVFSGYELGVRVLTGTRLHTGVRCPAGNRSSNPCAQALADFSSESHSYNRSSWDSVTSLFATRGDTHSWYTLVTNGHNTASDQTGANAWVAPVLGQQAYLLLNETSGVAPIEQAIDDLLCALPSSSSLKPPLEPLP